MFRNISFMLCSFYERQQTKKLRRSRGGVSAVFWGIVSDGSPVFCICTGIGAFASCFFSFALCSVYATVPLRQHRILAGAGLIIANRDGLYQYSLCNSGAGRSSPLRRGVWLLCVRAGIACVSGFFCWACIFRFSFVLMGKRRR